MKRYIAKLSVVAILSIGILVSNAVDVLGYEYTPVEYYDDFRPLDLGKEYC